MLIYRQLKKEIAQTEEALYTTLVDRVPNETPIRQELIAKYRALKELEEYADTLDWVKTAKTKEKVLAIINANFNYQEVAKQYNTSVNSLKSMFSRIDKRLKAKIEEPLKLILSGKPKEGIDLFKLGDKGYQEKVFREQLPLLETLVKTTPKKPTSDFYVVDLITALKFIKIYSKPQYRKGIEKAGEEEVNYLLYILFDQSSQFKFQREVLLQYLNNEITLEEVVRLFSELEEITANTKTSQ